VLRDDRVVVTTERRQRNERAPPFGLATLQQHIEFVPTARHSSVRTRSYWRDIGSRRSHLGKIYCRRATPPPHRRRSLRAAVRRDGDVDLRQPLRVDDVETGRWNSSELPPTASWADHTEAAQVQCQAHQWERTGPRRWTRRARSDSGGWRCRSIAAIGRLQHAVNQYHTLMVCTGPQSDGTDRRRPGLADDGQRYEVIDGGLFVTPASLRLRCGTSLTSGGGTSSSVVRQGCA
jgi:hypothetical protein